DQDIIPGKANENIGCVVTKGGKTYSIKSGYEVLMGHDYDWVERHGGDAVPNRAFVAGHDLNSNPIFVGKCDLHFGQNETQVVGKVDHKFYYGWGDVERSDCLNHMVMTSDMSSQNTSNASNRDELAEMDNDSDAMMEGSERRKRVFGKELRCMMYGFGDDHNPFTESVDMLEDLVIQFVADISLKAQEVGKNGKISVEDVLHCVKRDERKYSRVRDLLSMNEELKKARKAFDEI
ncbi:unnamed protein product, partial [Oppiella nova]